MSHYYLPPGMSDLDKINHFLIANGTQYEAEAVAQDETLVRVKDPTGACEYYKIGQLAPALEECGSTDEVRRVLEGPLALD